MKIHLLALALAVPGTAFGQQFLFNKTETYSQTSTAAPVLLTGSGLYAYSMSIQMPSAATVTPPGLASVTVPYSSSNSDYELDTSYATLAALNAAYPDGTYAASATGYPAFTANLTGDLYSTVLPQVMGGTWQNGLLILNPAVSNTLTFSNFTGYGSTGVGAYEGLNLNSATGADNINLKQSIVSQQISGLTYSATPFTTYVIPANTLGSGLVYQLSLNFGALSNLNTTTISGGLIVGIFESQLEVYVATQSSTAIAGPTIASQPANVTGPAGGSATFNVSVTFNGSSQFPNNTIFNWYVNGQSINFGGNGSGGSTSKYFVNLGGGGSGSSGGIGSLTINSLAASDAGTYLLQVYNAGGLVYSQSATLTIGPPATTSAPVFTTQPQSATLAAGSTAVFNAAVTGSPTPTLQWRLNGSPISGANQSSLLVGATAANAGTYTCVATNSAGSTTSSAATLSVATTNNPGRLIDISCRAPVGTGANVLIAGLVVGGAGTSGSESLLFRASGPALVPYGVTGTLPDPQLTLNNSGGVVATNNGWGGNAAIASTASAVGAFAWTSPSSHDAALLETAPAGAYTAEVSGASGDTGVALIEVYDATPVGTYTLTTPRLVDISARVQVGTGANVLIAGFVIGGTTSKSVLIRASGPALIPYGVTGTLPDPQLTLNNSTGVVATNTGWGGNQQIATTAASVGAFSWGGTATADSALLVTLPPGAYTAQIAGASGDTGVALIEVYEVP